MNEMHNVAHITEREKREEGREDLVCEVVDEFAVFAVFSSQRFLFSMFREHKTC